MNFYHDPASTDENRNTVLHTAAQYGQYEVVEFLINHNHQCPIDHRNSRGQTALHWACIGGHTRIAKLLVANKADITIRDEDGDTPLKKAFLMKHTHTLFELFNSNLQTIDSKLLHQLCVRGCVNLLDILLSDFNLDPSSDLDDQGNQILHIAALQRHRAIITLVINKYKCSVDSRNFNEQTPLHLLCSQTPTEHVDTLIKLLIMEFKADVSSIDKNRQTPLHMLCSQASAKSVYALIKLFITEFKADVKSRDKSGITPLHLLCSQAPSDNTEVLIKSFVTEFKADVKSRDESGQTPLHLLCSQAPSENTEALIKVLVSEFKADVTSKDNKGDQPIHVAAQTGCTSTVINLIVGYDCSFYSRGFKKRTLLHHALATGRTSTAKTLLDNNLSLHCTDEDGNTPLHLSSLYGQPESVRFLLYEYHAPIYVRNKAGKTALDIATDDYTKKVIREYVRSKHKSIQQEYEDLRAKSLQKYSGQQILTRVFVLGNSGSGKSTLVESLKRKGFSYFFTVTEADVPLHTAGIVPSIHQSKDAG